jgi:hypothetical protein
VTKLRARLSDGRPCLGRIARTSVSEIADCESCGKARGGVVHRAHRPDQER